MLHCTPLGARLFPPPVSGWEQKVTLHCYAAGTLPRRTQPHPVSPRGSASSEGRDAFCAAILTASPTQCLVFLPKLATSQRGEGFPSPEGPGPQAGFSLVSVSGYKGQDTGGQLLSTERRHTSWRKHDSLPWASAPPDHALLFPSKRLR